MRPHPAQVARLYEADVPGCIALSRAGSDVCHNHLNRPAVLRILPGEEHPRGW